jgi:DNA-binding HxlR family transcriptional regulator
MQIETGSKQSLSGVRGAQSLAEALEQAEGHCKDCKMGAASPMVCVERCDVWRVKHEILETRGVVSEGNHVRRLLNVLKNQRRLRIIDAMRERPLGLEELQSDLREAGFMHSRRTIIEAYVRPMIRVGLVKEDGVGFRTTFYGRKIRDILAGLGSLGPLNLLPVHSCCYEETVLKELVKPKTFNELAAHVPQKSLSRILMRLRARGLLVESLRRDYVFYHRVKGKPRMKLSPTEKRVFEAIPQVGIPARELAKIVGINLRRTYKYLRRLRAKKIVFALRANRTYESTVKGREIVNVIDEMEKLALSSLSAQVPIAQSRA